MFFFSPVSVNGYGSHFVIDELRRDKDTTKIHEPEFSQPICTAVQIALVDLLRSWGVKPSAVVGHSSGEIAAAYAAGALSLESAMIVAYYRGLLSSQIAGLSKPQGSMIAVGLSADETQKYISRVSVGKMNIACYNSPRSMTISGDDCAILELERLLLADKIFARLLKVNVAYHSHHMKQVEGKYSELLQNLRVQSCGDVQFYSSVTGSLVDRRQLGGDYWVRNLASPVLFSAALQSMFLDPQTHGRKTLRTGLNIDMLIEIGPHSALAGPIKQTISDADSGQELRNAKIPYSSCLIRDYDAVQTLHETACELIANGYLIDLRQVNNPADKFQPRTLVDLPPYSWNHSTKYWHESRISRAYRHRKDARRDLLGAPVADFNPIEPRWRGFIRVPELPWVKDHKVQRNILYPASGMIVMVIEAMQQISTRSSVEIVGFRLRDIKISKAIAVPDNNEGVETTFTLRPLSTSSVASSDQWYEFRLFTISGEGVWTEHCRGCVAVIVPNGSGEIDNNKEVRHKKLAVDELFANHKRLCENFIDIEELYEKLDNIGLSYGPAFQNFLQLQSSENGNLSLGLICIPDTTKFMPHKFEYPYILHPTTLDSVIQTVFPALTAGGRELQNPLIPTFIKEMTISNSGLNVPGMKLKVASSASWKGFQHVNASIAVSADDDSLSGPLIDVKNLRCSSISHASAGNAEPRKLCFSMIWDDDIDLINFADAKHIFPNWDRDEKLSSEILTLEETAFMYMKRALCEIKPIEIEKMQSHHQVFYQWMKRVSEKVAKGEMQHQNAKWLSVTEQEEQELIQSAENCRAEGRLLCRVGQNLVRILRKEIDPLSLMMEGDLLYEAYRTAFGMDRCYEQVTAIVDKLANKRPDLKILEVGAGTGGITLPILRMLGGYGDKYPRFSHYDFTDISDGFFERARLNFEPWSSLMDFRRLDIGDDPDTQGFTAGSYDLIIAANVLHATSEIKKTLHNVRKLLRTGGKLVLLELTQLPLRLGVVFGNLPGWWFGKY